MESFDFQKYMIDLADLFVQLERSLCEFYRTCQQLMPKYESKWQALCAEEEKHAALYEEIRESIRNDLPSWSRGKMRPQALQVMTASIISNTQKLLSHEIAPKYGITFIGDVENSLVESAIFDSFSCSVPAMQAKINRIHSESRNHRKILLEIKNDAFGQ